ncbi:MAG TPA: DUF559 domain-containing protein [Candidatus Dormibacteraeota bacterium]
MPQPLIPPELGAGPFSLGRALRAGLSRHHLESRVWRRLAHQTYALRDAPTTPEGLLAASLERLPPETVFSGTTAAWLHGLDLSPTDPIDVTLPPGSVVSQRVGLRVHRRRLSRAEIVPRGNFSITSIERTLFDLARDLPLVEAVVAADMALYAGQVRLGALTRFAWRRGRWPGSRKLRRVIELAEPKTESPMETRLRMRLVLAGLPRPEAQVELHDAEGHFLARADLYYPEARLVLEFDGSVHRDRLTEDSRRQNQLLAAGYRLLRFTTADVLGRPETVVALVRGALT